MYENQITNNKIDCCCDKMRIQFDYENKLRDIADQAIITYVNGNFVPGKLVMPLASICPPAAPATTTTTGAQQFAGSHTALFLKDSVPTQGVLNTMPNMNNSFGGFYGQNQSPSNVESAYQDLMRMRTTPYNNYRTVFNDISDE